MAIRLDESELSALAFGEWSSQLSHEAKVLYMLVIRPAMDFATGLAGLNTVVSYQKIAEILEYDPPAGSKAEPRIYNKRRIQGRIKELERAGLIEWRKSQDRGLVFQCLLATTDASVFERTVPGRSPDGPQSTVPDESARNAPGMVPENSQEGAASMEVDGPRDGPDDGPEDGSGTVPEEARKDGPASGGPGSGVPHYTAHAREALDSGEAVPDSPQAWQAVFVNELGFDPNQVMTPKAVAMYRDWIEARVAVQDLRDAVQAVAERGDTVNPAPTYYRSPVMELAHKRRGAHPQPGRPPSRKGGMGRVARTGFGEQDYGETGGRF